MADDAAKVASAYFDAWKANDFDTMRSLEAARIGSLLFILADSPRY